MELGSRNTRWQHLISCDRELQGLWNVLRGLPGKWRACGSLVGGTSRGGCLGDSEGAKRGSEEQPQIQKYLCSTLPSPMHINFQARFLTVGTLRCIRPWKAQKAASMPLQQRTRARHGKQSPGCGPHRAVASQPSRGRQGWTAGLQGTAKRCRTSVSMQKLIFFFQAVSQKCIRGEISRVMHFPRHFSCRKCWFCVLQTKVRGVGRKLLQQQTTLKFARADTCT